MPASAVLVACNALLPLRGGGQVTPVMYIREEGQHTAAARVHACNTYTHLSVTPHAACATASSKQSPVAPFQYTTRWLLAGCFGHQLMAGSSPPPAAALSLSPAKAAAAPSSTHRARDCAAVAGGRADARGGSRNERAAKAGTTYGSRALPPEAGTTTA